MQGPLSRLLALLAATLLLAANTFAEDLSASIASSDDWSREAALAEATGAPILMVFSAPECGYCERLKSQVIVPLLDSPEQWDPLIIREYLTNTGGKIGDFDGERIRARVFLRRYDVFATPTVVLLDPKGRPLTSPLVGFNSADSYKSRLQHAIETAQQSLHVQSTAQAMASAF